MPAPTLSEISEIEEPLESGKQFSQSLQSLGNHRSAKNAMIQNNGNLPVKLSRRIVDLEKGNTRKQYRN